MQMPAAARSEIDLADGILGGQAQPVGRGGAAGDDGFAPKRGKCFQRGADARRARTEAGLDRAHVDALADAQQPAGARETRESLVYRCSSAQMEESGRTKGCRLRQGRGVLHDALRKAGHDPVH